MKKIILLSLIFSLSLEAAEALPLFFIERSKNKNEVHYELLMNENCNFKEKDPVHGFWLELEKGPNIKSEIGTFEYIAYGISEQKKEGDWVHFKMKAIENKKFKARALQKNGKCEAEAWTDFKGTEGILKKVYIFAVEGMIKPTVKYIDLFGVNTKGEAIQERLEF